MDVGFCLFVQNHCLNARGAEATGFLKRCVSTTPMFDAIVHFAFGKRVWTRYAPTARAGAAICVQRFDDSLNPAIHITYRVSRRSSSLLEPRDPSLKGGFWFECLFVQKPLVVWVRKEVVCAEHTHESFLYTVFIFERCECY